MMDKICSIESSQQQNQLRAETLHKDLVQMFLNLHDILLEEFENTQDNLQGSLDKLLEMMKDADRNWDIISERTKWIVNRVHTLVGHWDILEEQTARLDERIAEIRDSVAKWDEKLDTDGDGKSNQDEDDLQGFADEEVHLQGEPRSDEAQLHDHDNDEHHPQEPAADEKELHEGKVKDKIERFEHFTDKDSKKEPNVAPAAAAPPGASSASEPSCCTGPADSSAVAGQRNEQEKGESSQDDTAIGKVWDDLLQGHMTKYAHQSMAITGKQSASVVDILEELNKDFPSPRVAHTKDTLAAAFQRSRCTLPRDMDDDTREDTMFQLLSGIVGSRSREEQSAEHIANSELSN